MLDSSRLRAELGHVHRILNSVSGGSNGHPLFDVLRVERAHSGDALIWQSLFADCLRVVYAAISSDDDIGDDEIEALEGFLYLVMRQYAVTIPDGYGGFDPANRSAARGFLDEYAKDVRSFGRCAELGWPGLALCLAAAEIGETSAFERYERLMAWLIPAACTIGNVVEGDPKWRHRTTELDTLRRALFRAAKVEATPADRRIEAFLSEIGVFASVRQPSSIFEEDPLDVDTIHHDARVQFDQMLDRATGESQEIDRGRILLLLGDAGAGKTHLLRNFVRRVRQENRGFIAYAQLHSTSDDYARYLLQNVVTALTQPYGGPSGERTGLSELSRGMARLVSADSGAKILNLADGDWPSQYELPDYIDHLTDELLRYPALATFEADLLRVLLFAIYPDQRTASRAYSYLRCQDMRSHDRSWIGHVAPKLDKGDPIKMIKELARLAHVTQKAAFVLMVDQAELAGFDDAVGSAFRRAVDTLYSIVSEVPSAIAVVACLKDLYEALRPHLSRYATDRLERDPPRVDLRTKRSYDEIEDLVGRRLAWMYRRAGVIYRPEEPVYPIPETALRELTETRTRDVLDWCHQFQQRCANAGRILVEEGSSLGGGLVHVEPPLRSILDQISAAWNDALNAPDIEIPTNDDLLLGIVESAATACGIEIDLMVISERRPKTGTLSLQLGEAGLQLPLVVAITNRSFQAGAFPKQLTKLKKASKGGVPVAVRTLKYPNGPVCNQAVAALLKSGGRRALLDENTLRTVTAFQRFNPPFAAAHVRAWLRRDQPVSSLPSVIELFDLGVLLDRNPDARGVENGSAAAGGDRKPPATATGDADPLNPEPPKGGKRSRKRPRVKDGSSTNGSAQPGPGAPTRSTPIRVGMASFGAEPRDIEVASLLRHTGILGSPGSGKTTLALNLVEQALERDVAVVLVDRKGDLAGYAKPDWWKSTTDPVRARKLAERIDVRLFTPGTRGGRPLSLSVIPDLENLPEHERDRMVQHSANALASMMNLGDSSNDSASRAILTLAIGVLAERQPPGGLPELMSMLENRDDQLLARAGRYDDKLFRRLVQNLDTVGIHDSELFDTAAEPLTAETLIGRKPAGKVPLTIVSTRFLGDDERIQSWVAHLLGCLNRYAARAPSTELRTLLMIDEADLFMPAGAAKPPSKEPLQDLLKRARAAGIGIMLASQSPGDFDYRSREQINTWFLGRIAEKRSIDKMKPLFEQRPATAGKLGVLDAGRFVMLQAGGSSDLDRTPSLLRTEQLGEAELMMLAAQHRAAGSR